MKLSFMILALAAAAVKAQVGGVVGVTTVDSSEATPAAGYGAPASSTAAAAPAAASSSSAPVTGDSTCVTSMCIGAVVNSTTATYTLESRSGAPGWMAMGFGTKMANAAMVIMWSNSDGTVTLSQRSAPSEVQPTVASNPPRVATLVQELSSANSTGATFVFTVPVDGSTTQSIVYALSDTNPNDASTSANLVQHTDFGSTSLDLTKVISTGSSNGTAAAGSIPASASSSSAKFVPYSSYEKMIIAHAIFSTIGFLALLPMGVLVARYLRTTGVKWFGGHWLIQFVFGGAAIAIGFFLGVGAVSSQQGIHFNDPHKRLGLVIILLYIVQCSLGAFIHFIKIGWANGRPVQNYAHVVLGLTIIGLALFQVHTGLQTEWVQATGRPPISKSLTVLFIIWVILLPAMYAAGLPMVPKQYRQEKIARMQKADRMESKEDGFMASEAGHTDASHAPFYRGGQYV